MNKIKILRPPERGNTSRVGELADGQVLGVLYGSSDKKYHIALYIPWALPPRDTLCRKYVGHLTATGVTDTDKLCEICEAEALKMLSEDSSDARKGGERVLPMSPMRRSHEEPS